MRKQLITFGFVFCLFFGAASQLCAQNRGLRVRIDVSGFQDNDDGLLAVTTQLRKIQPDIRLVRSDPDQILEVEASVFQFKNWTAIDEKIVKKNAGKRVIGVLADEAGYALQRHTGGFLNRVINEGRSTVVNETYNRIEDPTFQKEKWKGKTTVRLRDAHTGRILLESIGEVVVIVKSRYPRYGVPEIILVEGDLSAVGMQPGDNLDGGLRQILALAAFNNANDEKNIVGGK